MIPSIVLVIPFYLWFQSAGVLDSVASLSITYLTFSVPFAIWVIRGFFAAISIEIDEAARMDGANAWTILWRIILPIAAPPVLTTAVLIFCSCRNEFLFALVLTDQSALPFLPMLMRFVPPPGYVRIFAGSTIYFAVCTAAPGGLGPGGALADLRGKMIAPVADRTADAGVCPVIPIIAPN